MGECWSVCWLDEQRLSCKSLKVSPSSPLQGKGGSCQALGHPVFLTPTLILLLPFFYFPFLPFFPSPTEVPKGCFSHKCPSEKIRNRRGTSFSQVSNLISFFSHSAPSNLTIFSLTYFGKGCSRCLLIQVYDIKSLEIKSSFIHTDRVNEV